MAITKNTDYVGEGLGRLLAQFKDQPNIAALIAAWLTECQGVENAMWGVFVDRVLQNDLAVGDMLDKLGGIVGQERGDLADNIYRVLIMARIKTNRSSGRREELINIAQIITPDWTVYFNDLPPASYLIETQGPIFVDPYLIALSFLGPATTAGVVMQFVWINFSYGNAFVLGSTYGGVTPTATQSLGSVYTGAVGGGLGGVVEVSGGP